MERHRTSTSMSRCMRFAAVTVLAGVTAGGSLGLAQGQDDRAIEQAQRAVMERIASQEGGNVAVDFGREARTEFPSNTDVRVRGTGSVTRGSDGRSRPFSYEAVVNTRNGNVSDIRYDWRGGWYSGGGSSASADRLTGTYRLNRARSDDAATTADRVTRNLPAGDQQRLRTAVMRRLEAPDSLAIGRDGRTITMASSRAERVTFEADGRDQVEQSWNGRQVRTNAALSGDRLVVSTEGDRSVDYEVTFEPMDNGRSLRVTRRITHEDLRQAVVAASVYDKTSDAPQWNVYAGPGDDSRWADPSRERHLVPDGTALTAVLNETLSTRQAREGDRFTLTVRSPSQYAGATIDGHLTRVARSGQVSGRAEMSFEFDDIRTSGGRLYDFTGYIESVRTVNDDEVRVDSEGSVQDESSQTGRTVARTGIGAAIGAVIGAVTGGGTGAAIGAAIGAGAGAGSVFIQGRNDLDLASGSEFRIRASAPR